MFRLFTVLIIIASAGYLKAQNALPKKIIKNRFLDSAALSAINPLFNDDLPVIGVEENTREDNPGAAIPSLLFANRDLLVNTASFHFSVVRFRLRGYENNASQLTMNGVPMNNPEDGQVSWNLWSGLNEVMRNAQTSMGIRATDYAYGDLGTNAFIDTRASRQRVQTSFTYALSNRSYTHRISFTHSTGMQKNGWAFTFSGSYRYADKGYYPGTFYNGKSYFVGIDKKINEQQLLSFSFFGASLFTGKQSPVLEETKRLLGTKYYNAYWGYQSVKIRNANTRFSHQPVMLLRHDLQLNNHTSLRTAIGMIAGSKIDTGLDWYQASDPRPDYYRNLPSFQRDTGLQNNIKEAIQQNNSLLQINWNHFFNINRNSLVTINNADGFLGNTVLGLRSRYIVEDRIASLRRFCFSNVFHALLPSGADFVSGISLQWQRTHYYKRINDLLGGDFYVNWNQFAAREYPNDSIAMQQDIHHPNRLLRKGDPFGYDFSVHTLQAKGWMQLSAVLKKIDYFIGSELAYTNYEREGGVANGLFPNHSLGKSPLNEFTGFAFKGGITYKINGRKYFYAQVGLFIKAPYFDNVFISPKINAFRQDEIRTEKVATAELGYIWNAPNIKLRLTGYFTRFMDGMNISSFYHDGYSNFVNYALSGIDKLHAGAELGLDYKISSRFSFQLVGSFARYYYDSRQNVVVTADNNASVLERNMVFAQNFRVGGTPQEAYSAAISYQSARYFFMNISGNYFRQHWLDFNPLRRTQGAILGMQNNEEERKKILQQLLLPEQYTVDFSAGTSTRLKFGKALKTLLFFFSVNNLLNQQLISGGYEQLRFDMETKNPEKFPPKFFYAMGLNFSLNLTLRV